MSGAVPPANATLTLSATLFNALDQQLAGQPGQRRPTTAWEWTLAVVRVRVARADGSP